MHVTECARLYRASSLAINRAALGPPQKERFRTALRVGMDGGGGRKQPLAEEDEPSAAGGRQRRGARRCRAAADRRRTHGRLGERRRAPSKNAIFKYQTVIFSIKPSFLV